MRKLTILRKKSFVGSLGIMKIYIEDSNSNDLVIKDVKCRKLGTLKNGEEVSFEIDDNAAKVFVIAGAVSKDYCNEFVNIPAGTEDIYLTGKNELNLATGNAFRFDGITDEEVLKNRKKGSKLGIIVLVFSALIGAIFGFVIAYYL